VNGLRIVCGTHRSFDQFEAAGQRAVTRLARASLALGVNLADAAPAVDVSARA
jgi:hypothetical protein